ncbi:DUF3772 domain-containing protein [Acetobacter conturbans]|nr:DUF3772 domain-containing protein [Acetobacter conturbans]
MAVCLMAVSLFSSMTVHAQAAEDHDSLIAVPAAIVPDKALDALETSIRTVFQARVDEKAAANGSSLLVNDLVQQASTDETTAQGMVSKLEPYEKIYKSLLDVLGTAPGKGEPPEPVSITQQRTRLLQAQHDLSTRLVRARLYMLEAHQIAAALSQKTNAAQQALLLQRFPSPLSPGFWKLISGEFPATRHQVEEVVNDAGQGIGQAMKGWGPAILFGCVAAGCCFAAAPFFLLRQTRRAAARLLPVGRVRQITAIALFSGLCSLCAGLFVWMVWLGLTGSTDIDGTSLMRLAGAVGGQIPLVGFVLGAGATILSPRNQDWRLAPISDAAARALQSFSIWFSLLLILRGILRYVDTEAGIGPNTIQLADVVFILAAAPLLFCAPMQLLRYPLPQTDQSVTLQSMIGRAVRVMALFVSLFSVAAMLIGYIPLGYTTLSWVCSMVVTLLALTLIFLLANDLGRTEFLSSGRIGRHLVSLGLSARVVDQGITVFTGLFSVFLLFVAVAVAQSGGDFDFGVIFDNLGKVVFGQKIGGVTLSFDVLLKCIAVPVLGHYLIKLVQYWLQKCLFPTTALDLGAQTSIIAIFTYAAWIGVILTVMGTIGVTVSSMTWVVSALSVGIGFGLQSIVQNFVSGIILLAERPVTIGDMVEIGGKTGDIRRISVRSTDIALSDGSTLIVPNSQFITSAVRNATFGRPSGAMAFTVGLPLGTDLSKAISVMASALQGVGELLTEPAPSVSIADIQADTVTLKISGKTSSPRSVDRIANDARLAVWDALKKNGIVASMESSS